MMSAPSNPPPPPPGLGPSETMLLMLGEMRGQLAAVMQMLTAAEKTRGEMREVIEKDIAALRGEIKEAETTRAEQHKAIEGRVEKLERRLVWATGAAAPIIFLFSFFSDRILGLIWPR